MRGFIVVNKEGVDSLRIGGYKIWTDIYFERNYKKNKEIEDFLGYIMNKNFEAAKEIINNSERTKEGYRFLNDIYRNSICRVKVGETAYWGKQQKQELKGSDQQELNFEPKEKEQVLKVLNKYSSFEEYLESLNQDKVCHYSNVKNIDIKNFLNVLCSLDKKKRISFIGVIIGYFEKYKNLKMPSYVKISRRDYLIKRTNLDIMVHKTNLFNPSELENYYDKLSAIDKAELKQIFKGIKSQKGREFLINKLQHEK